MEKQSPGIKVYKASLPNTISGIVFWGMVFVGLVIAYLVQDSKKSELEKQYLDNAAILQSVIVKSLAYSNDNTFSLQTRKQLEENLQPFCEIIHCDYITVKSGANEFEFGKRNDGFGAIKSTFTIQPVFAHISPYQAHTAIYFPAVENILSGYRKSILLTIGFLMMLFGLALQFILQHILTQPFNHMMDTAREYADGSQEARFDEKREDEFGFLAKFINLALDASAHNHDQMSDALARAVESEASLRESEMRFRTIFRQSPIAMEFSRDGRVVDGNPAYLEMFRFHNMAEVMGRAVIDNIAPQCRKNMLERMESKSPAEGAEATYETVGMRADGTEFPVLVSSKAVMFEDGSMTCTFLMDITERHKAEERMKHLAFYDQLTELPNRRLFNDRLKQAILLNSRTQQHGAVLLIDLDNFKTVNDSLGHAAGDELLLQVALRIDHSVRGGDTVARLGGDEFVVLLENIGTSIADAGILVENIGLKILESLQQPFQLSGKHSSSCSASIGVILFGGHMQVADELLKQADIAMYQAKADGRNCLRFFDPAMQENVNKRVKMERELDEAVLGKQFELYAQVQQDHKNQVLGAELLIRWSHPSQGIISPLEFIPLAESAGMIIPIGKWVIEKACAQLEAWEENPLTRDLSLAVNVSSEQIHDPGFVAHVLSAIEMHGIRPGKLKMELTESTLLANVEEMISRMKALKAVGVEFALDDFGTGYSSLQYLNRLPLNQLKIDQTFVRDMVANPNGYEIVRMIIGMAQNLGLEVIAEGVETELQKKLLLESGCTKFQGHLFGKPATIEEFEALLMARKVVQAIK